MDWKIMSIKDYFEKTLQARKLSDESCPGADYCDSEENLFILLRNYDETVCFLVNATEKEIACTVDVLEELVEALPKEKAQVIVDIFKKKLAEYPNVQDYAVSEYVQELLLAQEIVDDKET